MKKHRAQSDTAILEMLRSRGAVIGPTAGEALQAAVAKLDAHATHNGERRDAETLPRGAVPAAAPRSSIRRFKSQTEHRFAAHLNSLVAEGKILRWRYEAERLQLADHGQPAVTYTPDFVAWLPGGRRIFYEVKSRFHRDSDTETRRIFLWARQQFADAAHEFHAYREIDGQPGAFREMWGEDQLTLTAGSEPAILPP